MPDSIQDRLKKVPPFEEDIPMMEEVRKISKQQTSTPLVKEEPKKEEVVEEKKEEPAKETKKEEKVEEVKKEAEEKPKKKKKSRTTEQFDKLKEHNKQLKEENVQVYKNVMDSLKPELPEQDFTPQVIQQVDKHTTELQPDKVDDIYAKLIDKDGYIDPDLLIKTLRSANEEAKQARKEAEEAKKQAETTERESKRTIRDFEEDREVRRVHKKYPQIDPKNKDFNELFWDDVRKEIATAPYLKGTTPSFMEAADMIWNQRYAPKEVDEVKKKEKEKMEAAEDKKKQINASVPTGRPGDYYSKTDAEVLKQATIHGKKGALAERLRRAGQ